MQCNAKKEAADLTEGVLPFHTDRIKAKPVKIVYM
jgi:hypothetical protein